MDPITGLPPVTGPGTAPGVDPTAPATPATGAEGAVSDAQLEEYKAVAAGFVSQMYMTLWREAQRNGSNGG